MATKKKIVQSKKSGRLKEIKTSPGKNVSIKVNTPKEFANKVIMRKHRMREFNKYFSQKVDEQATSALYSEVLPILNSYKFTQIERATLLDVNPSTISRWKSKDGNLRPLNVKNIYDLEDLRLKGISVFGDEANFLKWLESENFALGNNKPKQMILDPFGLEYVDEALDALRGGAVV